MKKTLICALLALIAAPALFSQTSPEDYLARYNRQVKAVGETGVGVETILDRWQEAWPEDVQQLRARFNFLFAKSRRTEVVHKAAARYLGQNPILSLKDSTGANVNYFQEDFFEDSLFAASASAISKAIALQPLDLGLRMDRIDALLAYEKGSPDMATPEILSLIDYNKTAKPEWTEDGQPSEAGAFDSAIMYFCSTLFRLGSDGTYAAFRTISEKMLSVSPKNPTFLGNMGLYWQIAGKDKRKALKYYDKVLKLSPTDYPASKNSVILARTSKDKKLEKKYLPFLIANAQSETEKVSAQARLESLSK